MKRGIWIIIMGLILVTSTACNKDATVDEFPVISLVSVSPTSVVQFEEKVTITINYQDGNGDIGFEDPDVTSLSVKDSRLELPDLYHIQPLAPIGSDIAIKGILPIELKNTFILGNGEQETFNYEIRLQDRAGNWSNTLTTSTITVTK